MARTAATALAALTLVAVAGCTAAPRATPAPSAPTASQPTTSVTVTPTPTARPAASGTTSTPSPSGRSTPRQTPRARPTSASELPGTLGTLSPGFKLPEEDRAATDETTAFRPAAWVASCVDGSTVRLSSVTGVTATRLRESEGPEHVEGRGLVQFSDEAAARSFMDELRTGYAGCPTDGEEQEGYRPHQEISPVDGLADGGLAVRVWTRRAGAGDAPGSTLEYVVRKGRHVALVWNAGEYLGDPVNQRELVEASRADVRAILDQI